MNKHTVDKLNGYLGKQCCSLSDIVVDTYSGSNGVGAIKVFCKNCGWLDTFSTKDNDISLNCLRRKVVMNIINNNKKSECNDE